MKKGITLGFVFLIILANSILLSAITGSMGNAKMVLYPEVNGWTNTVIEKSILVKNVNSMPINITLELDENASKFIELIDKSFILESGEEKKAQFEIRVKKEGKYEGRINVFFRPTEGKESGVVLSSTVIVITKKDNGYEETEEETLEEEITENEEKPTNLGSTDKPSKVMTYLTISTFVLILALIILFYIAGKKRTRNKVKKRRTHKWRKISYYSVY